MMTHLVGIATESFLLFARMAPYLLLGIAVAGALHILMPVGLVARSLGGRGIGPALRAALLGIPLPLCSCGVVPVAASLRQAGASRGATVSFLTSTPTSGVDSILATYSLLGWVFTLARVAASLVLGLLAGIITSLGVREDDVLLKNAAVSETSVPEGGVIARAFSYGFGELLGGMARSLAVGTLLGGAIAYFVPPHVVEQYIGDGLFSYVAMMAFGIPLYVCASGSIPMAAALLAKGISPGAALVFLITGPATNAATVAVISKLLGRRALVIFLSVLGLGAVASGLLLDATFSSAPDWIPEVMHHGHTEAIGWLETWSGIGLGLALVFHLAQPVYLRLRRKKGNDDMVQIRVPDMTCAHCAGSIVKAASAVEGVNDVYADPATKMVDIDMADDVDTDAVIDAIKSAGFSPENPG